MTGRHASLAKVDGVRLVAIDAPYRLVVAVAERRERLGLPRPAHASRKVIIGNARQKPPTMPLDPLPRPAERRVGWLDARMRGAR